MDERIRNRLEKTASDLCLYIGPAHSEVQEVFNFRPGVDLDATDSKTLSRYTLILGQYLITLRSRYNTANVLTGLKRKVLDRKVAEALKKGIIPGKTLKEREANAISANPALIELELEYDENAAERDLLEGLDKPIVELINALKSELKRRTGERDTSVRERY